jgi:uncharacterized protein (DUF1778 family)
VAIKAERLEARLTSTERKQIEQAAALAGESVSSFVVLAALDRADVLVRERASTVVPAAYFDQLHLSMSQRTRPDWQGRPLRSRGAAESS